MYLWGERKKKSSDKCFCTFFVSLAPWINGLFQWREFVDKCRTTNKKIICKQSCKDILEIKYLSIDLVMCIQKL